MKNKALDMTIAISEDITGTIVLMTENEGVFLENFRTFLDSNKDIFLNNSFKYDYNKLKILVNAKLIKEGYFVEFNKDFLFVTNDDKANESKYKKFLSL